MDEFRKNLISEMSKLGVEDPEGVLANRPSTPMAKHSSTDIVYHHLDEISRANACTINPWKEGLR